MANPYGRSVIVALVNKSGGGVVAGDFVYPGDGATADSFTTGTTANRTGAVGIAQQTIASNATGLVCIGGYVSLVNVNASVTLNHYGASFTVAKQATDAGASRAAGTCLYFLTAGTTPDAFLWQPDLGAGSGITNPGGMAAGAALSSINSAIAWNSGTSMPGSKATGDRYWRTDLGMEAYWDGTRWLTTQLFAMSIQALDAAINAGVTGVGANNLGRSPVPYKGTYGLYLTTVELFTFVSTTNTSSAFWTPELKWGNAAGTFSSLGTVSTGTVPDTASNYVYHTIAINAVLDASAVEFTYLATKTSTPGLLLSSATLLFRLVLT